MIEFFEDHVFGIILALMAGKDDNDDKGEFYEQKNEKIY